jgi:hypothetical protein
MFRKVSIVAMAVALIFTASVAFCGTDATGESDAVKITCAQKLWDSNLPAWYVKNEITRTQGLCSHHGGYNAATKKCKDGTTPAENAAAAIAAEEAAKAKQAAAIKARKCKSTTAAYDKLVNDPKWKQVQADPYGGKDATYCKAELQEKMTVEQETKCEPLKVPAKIQACKNKITTAYRPKLANCDLLVLWATGWSKKVEDAENARDTACSE